MPGYQVQLNGARFIMKIQFLFVLQIRLTQFAGICQVVLTVVSSDNC